MDYTLKVSLMLRYSRLTLQQVADEVGTTLPVVRQIANLCMTTTELQIRKSVCYSRSKLGDKNPMTGKTGDAHHCYVGDVSDGKGYHMVLKPDWYTGRQGSKHVFKHQVVMCAALGLTELPAGYVVHHVDGNKQNNDLNNLALMTQGAHTRLHQRERATTIRKEYTPSPRGSAEQPSPKQGG